jgi:DNA-binding transcriptional regulator YiaG
MKNPKRFAPRCGNCKQKTMQLATVVYDAQIGHDGQKYDIHLDQFEVPKCVNCGTLSFDDEANRQIDEAFRRVAGLLTADEIYQGRIAVGYSSQQEFADCLGLSVSTVSRWENGSQVQQHFCNGILRAFFQCAEFRQFMALQHGLVPKDPTDGTTGTAPVDFTSEPARNIIRNAPPPLAEAPAAVAS